MNSLLDRKQLLSLPDEVSHKRYWNQLAERPEAYITNAQTQLRFAISPEGIVPITINDCQWENSYVCSPYNGTITYPLEEIRLLPVAVRQCVAGLIHSTAPLLRFGEINRAIVVNNWMLSTNLYPVLTSDWIDQLLDSLLVEYPKHAILFRSLNRITNQPLMTHLQSRGFSLAPSRQVYFYDGKQPNFLDHHNTKIDMRLLEREPSYQVLDSVQLTGADFVERAAWLYGRLYLDKYSKHNPQFTSQLMKLWRESGVLQFQALQATDGSIDGVVGRFRIGDTITAPVVGYDTSKPQSLGLYRRLMALLLRQTAEEKLLLNLSSGAAAFKRLRGGQACIEYTAVACNHLPFRQRMTWKLLVNLLRTIAEPMLKRYEL